MTIGDQGGGGVQHGACHGCNKEVTTVVEEVNKELVNEVNEGLLLVCRCGDVVLDKEVLAEQVKPRFRTLSMYSMHPFAKFESVNFETMQC